MKMMTACLAALLALGNAPADAASANGGSALALATLVADQSPTLGGTERRLLKRLLNGRSPFSADRGHIHHRLLDRGFTPRRAALMLYAVCGVGAALSLLQVRAWRIA